jgi:hypothetical protein
METVSASQTAPADILAVAVNHRIDTLILVRTGSTQACVAVAVKASLKHDVFVKREVAVRAHDAGALRELGAVHVPCLRVDFVVRRIERDKLANSGTAPRLPTRAAQRCTDMLVAVLRCGDPAGRIRALVVGDGQTKRRLDDGANAVPRPLTIARTTEAPPKRTRVKGSRRRSASSNDATKIASPWRPGTIADTAA